MTTAPNTTTSILIAGHWLGAWAWDEVSEQLSLLGSPSQAITLPGLDPNDPQRAIRTLDDQVAAIEQAIADAGGEPVTLVAHSGANLPVSLLLDRRPELVRHVVWVDSGPAAPDSAFATDAPEELPLPPFDVLGEQASLEGLGNQALERFRVRAVPEPAPVLRQVIELHNDQRRHIPATMVCCSIASTVVLELVAAGHPMFAELSGLTELNLVDLPTGHWPMWSRPQELAEIIAAAS